MTGPLDLHQLIEAAVRAQWPEEITPDFTQTLRAHHGQELSDGRVICDACSGYFDQPVVLLEHCPALRALARMYGVEVEPLPPPAARS